MNLKLIFQKLHIGCYPILPQRSWVRSLEREIAKICRKTIKKIADPKEKKLIKVTPKISRRYFRVKKFDYGEAKDKDRIGQVTGLAWTQVGGELL
ncbi:MAG: hypothetical protein Ct9H90mP22_1770 [Gammaproteobacteria bacterium]|nr:MAG: hypothetical protein Ct9H90mP22_1770 [Gammaproteobacteria bacterium]